MVCSGLRVLGWSALSFIRVTILLDDRDAGS